MGMYVTIEFSIYCKKEKLGEMCNCLLDYEWGEIEFMTIKPAKKEFEHIAPFIITGTMDWCKLDEDCTCNLLITEIWKTYGEYCDASLHYSYRPGWGGCNEDEYKEWLENPEEFNPRWVENCLGEC